MPDNFLCVRWHALHTWTASTVPCRRLMTLLSEAESSSEESARCTFLFSSCSFCAAALYLIPVDKLLGAMTTLRHE